MPAKSVLIIGATGRTGVQLIHAFASHTSPPVIHAFARTPSKLQPQTAEKCTSVLRGDARNTADIAAALESSAADIVVIAVGVPNSTKPSDVREVTARALVQQIRPGAKYEHVRVVVVSSTGAGGTKIDIGFGMGTVLAYVLRHVMRDHDNQEREFKTAMGKDAARMMIVRPTALTDEKANGKVVTFSASERAPSSKIDRGDVAKWIVDQVCGSGKHFGHEVCLTGKK